MGVPGVQPGSSPSSPSSPDAAPQSGMDILMGPAGQQVIGNIVNSATGGIKELIKSTLEREEDEDDDDPEAGPI
jgi:hypothetical protein